MNDIDSRLRQIHYSLMYHKFPYHSVSVIHRWQDLGFHCILLESVKDKVTKEIEDAMTRNEFTWSFVKPN
jgi:hypothetical protein